MENKKSIDNYILFEKIGQGKFGSVYETYDEKSINKQHYATKVIEKALIIRYHLDEYLKNEINILLKCNHPNIIKLYEVKSTYNNFYLIMELCNGISLRDYIKLFSDNKRTMSMNIKRKIITEIAKAMNYYYSEKNIIHRDLKSENIMLHFKVDLKVNSMTSIDTIISLDNNFTIKIIDFGISKILKDKEDDIANTVLGTFKNMDPKILNANFEISFKDVNYGFEVDIWSFGVICYEVLFNGTLPFPFQIARELVEKYNEGWYYIPLESSVEEASFICSILQVKTENRAKISQILDHPFLSSKQITKINKDFLDKDMLCSNAFGKSMVKLSIKSNTNFFNSDCQSSKYDTALYKSIMWNVGATNSVEPKAKEIKVEEVNSNKEIFKPEKKSSNSKVVVKNEVKDQESTSIKDKNNETLECRKTYSEMENSNLNKTIYTNAPLIPNVPNIILENKSTLFLLNDLLGIGVNTNNKRKLKSTFLLSSPKKNSQIITSQSEKENLTTEESFKEKITSANDGDTKDNYNNNTFQFLETQSSYKHLENHPLINHEFQSNNIDNKNDIISLDTSKESNRVSRDIKIGGKQVNNDNLRSTSKRIPNTQINQKDEKTYMNFIQSNNNIGLNNNNNNPKRCFNNNNNINNLNKNYLKNLNELTNGNYKGNNNNLMDNSNHNDSNLSYHSNNHMKSKSKTSNAYYNHASPNRINTPNNNMINFIINNNINEQKQVININQQKYPLSPYKYNYNICNNCNYQVNNNMLPLDNKNEVNRNLNIINETPNDCLSPRNQQSMQSLDNFLQSSYIPDDKQSTTSNKIIRNRNKEISQNYYNDNGFPRGFPQNKNNFMMMNSNYMSNQNNADYKVNNFYKYNNNCFNNQQNRFSRGNSNNNIGNSVEENDNSNNYQYNDNLKNFDRLCNNNPNQNYLSNLNQHNNIYICMPTKQGNNNNYQNLQNHQNQNCSSLIVGNNINAFRQAEIISPIPKESTTSNQVNNNIQPVNANIYNPNDANFSFKGTFTTQ